MVLYDIGPMTYTSLPTMRMDEIVVQEYYPSAKKSNIMKRGLEFSEAIC